MLAENRELSTLSPQDRIIRTDSIQLLRVDRSEGSRGRMAVVGLAETPTDHGWVKVPGVFEPVASASAVMALFYDKPFSIEDLMKLDLQDRFALGSPYANEGATRFFAETVEQYLMSPKELALGVLAQRNGEASLSVDKSRMAVWMRLDGNERVEERLKGRVLIERRPTMLTVDPEALVGDLRARLRELFDLNK